MSKEYIEREALLKEIGHVPLWTGYREDNYSFELHLALVEIEQGLRKLVAEAPAADVEPVRHGKWIPIVSHFHGKPDGRYCCSVCHRVETMKGIYCRLCGAKMDGGNK